MRAATIPSPGKGRLKVAHRASGVNHAPIRSQPRVAAFEVSWCFGKRSALAHRMERIYPSVAFRARFHRWRSRWVREIVAAAGLEAFEVYQGSCRTAPLRSRLGCLPRCRLSAGDNLSLRGGSARADARGSEFGLGDHGLQRRHSRGKGKQKDPRRPPGALLLQRGAGRITSRS